MHDRAALRRGRVSLALLPSLAAGWLPAVLARFRALHPGIAVEVADVLSEPCIERVMTTQADFALAAVRAETPELQAQVFCADDFHLVCRADHPLAKARAPIRLRDLAAWPFIHLSRTSSVRQYLDAAFRPQAMDTVMEVDQLATVMGMVRAGLGISVVPALALFHFEQPEIATRPVPLPGLARRIYLVRRRDRSLSVAAQALHDLVLAERPPIVRPKAAAVRRRSALARPLVPRRERFGHRSRRFVTSAPAGARRAAYDRRMSAPASPLLEPATAAPHGDRRLWLGYAGLCLLCWLLYAIAGMGAERGSWQAWEAIYEATWNLVPPMLLGTLALPWVRWLQRRERSAPARLGAHALGALAFASLWHLLDFALSSWFFGRDHAAATFEQRVLWRTAWAVFVYTALVSGFGGALHARRAHRAALLAAQAEAGAGAGRAGGDQRQAQSALSLQHPQLDHLPDEEGRRRRRARPAQLRADAALPARRQPRRRRPRAAARGARFRARLPRPRVAASRRAPGRGLADRRGRDRGDDSAAHPAAAGRERDRPRHRPAHRDRHGAHRVHPPGAARPPAAAGEGRRRRLRLAAGRGRRPAASASAP